MWFSKGEGGPFGEKKVEFPKGRVWTMLTPLFHICDDKKCSIQVFLPKSILKIKIHLTQNVGKVWISRKKLPGLFGATFGMFP